MIEQKKMFQKIELITSLFIFVSMLSVCGVILFHLYENESFKKAQVRTKIGDYLISNQSEMAEALYFKLNEDLELREQQINTGIAKYANIHFEFLPNFKPNTDFLGWTQNENHSEEMYSQVLFGSQNLGTIKVILNWNSSLLFKNNQEIIIGLTIVILVSLLSWFLAFSFYKKTCLQPLLKQTLEKERIIATTDTARMLAHDAKRPFNLLYAFLQSLEFMDDIALIKQRIEKTLPRAKEASESLQQLIDSTITNENGTHKLMDICATALNEMNDLVEARLTDIEIELPEHLLVNGNKSDYVRIFHNLIANAIEATDPGQKVSVRGFKNSDGIIIEFNNECELQSTLTLKKLFEEGHSSKGKGRGIGLASVKRILTKIGASISVVTEARNIKFLIKMPV